MIYLKRILFFSYEQFFYFVRGFTSFLFKPAKNSRLILNYLSKLYEAKDRSIPLLLNVKYSDHYQ